MFAKPSRAEPTAQQVFPISIRQLALRENHRQSFLTYLGQLLSVATLYVLATRYV